MESQNAWADMEKFTSSRKFRLYIDETGDHTYKNLHEVDKKYLGLIGCVFDLCYVRDRLIPELDALKRRHFPTHDPDEPVILHRADIINRKGPFKVLKDKEVRNDFDGHLVRLFTNLNFKIIMVVIDKESHLARHSVHAWNPYHYCLKLLLERYCGFLNFWDATGDVMAESRGRKEDSQIKKEFRDFFENGTYYMAPEIIQNVLTSREIKLKKKNADIAGLQIADLLAHPSKQDILLDNGIITDSEIGDFCRRLLPVLRAKYNRNYKDNRIDGYGKIFR